MLPLRLSCTAVLSAMFAWAGSSVPSCPQLEKQMETLRPMISAKTHAAKRPNLRSVQAVMGEPARIEQGQSGFTAVYNGKACSARITLDAMGRVTRMELLDAPASVSLPPSNNLSPVRERAAKLRRELEGVTALEAALAQKQSPASPQATTAEELLAKHEYASAQKAFQERLLHDPSDEQALLGRAACSRHLGQWQAAAADYKAALRLHPDDPSLHASHAAVLLEMGEFGKARAELDKTKPTETPADAEPTPPPVDPLAWRTQQDEEAAPRRRSHSQNRVKPYTRKDGVYVPGHTRKPAP